MCVSACQGQEAAFLVTWGLHLPESLGSLTLWSLVLEEGALPTGLMLPWAGTVLGCTTKLTLGTKCPTWMGCYRLLHCEDCPGKSAVVMTDYGSESSPFHIRLTIRTDA